MGDIGQLNRLASPYCQPETAPETREFVSNSCRGRSLLAAAHDIPSNSIACDSGQSIKPEELLKMSERDMDSFCRASPIHLVIGQEHPAQILEGCPFSVRADQSPRAHLGKS